jgi:hypothetical protein
MFATIYGMNELSKKHLGTQENILCSLRFFYVYYFKKHKRTFDYDFYRSGYNIPVLSGSLMASLLTCSGSST